MRKMASEEAVDCCTSLGTTDRAAASAWERVAVVRERRLFEDTRSTFMVAAAVVAGMAAVTAIAVTAADLLVAIGLLSEILGSGAIVLEYKAVANQRHVVAEDHKVHGALRFREQRCNFSRICTDPRRRSTCSAPSYNCYKGCSSSSSRPRQAAHLRPFVALFLHEQNGTARRRGRCLSIANACTATSCICYCTVRGGAGDGLINFHCRCATLLDCTSWRCTPPR